jgi:predicted metal-dependent enzyme (double-stranded beta helix superfamily)
MITQPLCNDAVLADVISAVTRSFPYLNKLLVSARILEIVQNHARVHACGYLFWAANIGGLEVVAILWQPGTTSEIHDHRQAENLVIGLVGEVTVLRYHYSRNQRFVEWQEILSCGGLSHTPAWSSHEIINHTSEWAATLHFYYPRRK